MALAVPKLSNKVWGLRKVLGAATISAMHGFLNYYKKAKFLDKLSLQLRDSIEMS